MSFEKYLAFGQPFTRAAVLFFFMEINRFFSGPSSMVGLNLVIWATSAIVMFIPKAWWTKVRVGIIAFILIFESALGFIWFQDWKLIYFAAILLFAAAVRLSVSKSAMPALAVLLVTALLYIRYGRADLLNFLSFFLVAIVLFFGLRNRMQRNEMYERNQRHLKELQEAYDQLQEASVTAMQYAVLEERTRIAREIHDAVGHSLTSLIVQMQALRYMIKQDAAHAEHSLEGMLAVARQGLHDIRISVHSLADDRSISGVTPLKALLSRMEASTSIQHTFYVNINDEEMSEDVSGILFRVLQEALTNIIRHANATLVEVSLKNKSGNVVMRIRDNGSLQSRQAIREGFGLKVMKARLEEKGGRLRHSILEPHGFEILAELPALAEPRLQNNAKEG